MVGVVLGHWLVADVRWQDAEVVESSVLAQNPTLWPLTWLVLVIPVFFFAGGFGNVRAWRSARARGDGFAGYLDRRLHRLMTPVLVFLAIVVPVGLVVDALGGLAVAAAGGIVLQPLWFLGVYVLVVALTPLTVGWHQRWGVWVPVVLVGVSLLCDVAAFARGWSGFGYVNAVTVWLLVHQLGYFYADGRLTPRSALPLAVGGWAAAVLLTQLPWLPYSSFMVGVPGVDQGNMHPPTVAVLCLALAAIGTAVVLRPLLTSFAERDRVWRLVVLANLSLMTMYLWHETALVVAARLVLPLVGTSPVAGSSAWWMSHTLWLVVPSIVLAAIVWTLGAVERRTEPDRRVVPVATSTVGTVAASVAVGLLSAGLLALAGSPVTQPFTVAARLGPIKVSVVAGLLLTISAVAILRSMRRAEAALRVTAMTAAGALLVAAGLHAVGVGPVPQDAVVAGTLLLCGMVTALTAAVPVRRADGGVQTASRHR